MNHGLVLRSRYGLTSLLSDPLSRISITQSNNENSHLTSLTPSSLIINKKKKKKNTTNYELQPTIFWYDSNHICNVKKYLEIFTPFTSLPTDLRIELQKYDRHIVSKLLLKRGDFIEDRFGQAQRNLLASLKDNSELLLRTHHWFGSYLLYSPSTQKMKKEEYRQVNLKYCNLNEKNCYQNESKVESEVEYEIEDDNKDYEEYERENSDDEECHEENDVDENTEHLEDEKVSDLGDLQENYNNNNNNMNSVANQQNQSIITNPYAFNLATIMVVHLRGRHYDPDSRKKWSQKLKQEGNRNDSDFGDGNNLIKSKSINKELIFSSQVINPQEIEIALGLGCELESKSEVGLELINKGQKLERNEQIQTKEEEE